jgi:hypothetical protein
MPFSLTCPKCSSKLKTATAIPIGRDVQCPKCKEKFQVSRDNMEEVPESKIILPPNGSAKPAPATAAAKTASTNVAKQASPRRKSEEVEENNPFEDMEAPSTKGRSNGRPGKKVRDEDEETPRGRKKLRDEDLPGDMFRDEDDDDRPRKKVRDEDEEDETPRSRKKARDEEDEDDDSSSRKRNEDKKSRKKSRDEDDEDDAPRSRKRGDDDDDDDRPRRRQDEEEEDDRPRRGKKKKKKKGNALLLVCLAIFGLAAITGTVLLCIYMFGGGSYDKEMMAYMPDSTTIVGGVDVAQLMEVEMIKEQADKKTGPVADMPFVNNAGVSINDISKILFGTSDVDKEKPKNVVIFKFKNPVDKAKINRV